ncbi:MAG: hypothetical protein COB77_05180, partial [Gammaproteobacteria bacterium]
MQIFYFRNLIWLAVIVLLFVSVPTYNLLWREAFNSGHAVLFFFISIVIYQKIKKKRHALPVFSVCLLAFIFSMLVGVLVEVLQGLGSREASLADLVSDLFGVLSGLFFIAFLEHKDAPRYFLRKFILISLAAIFFITGI